MVKPSHSRQPSWLAVTMPALCLFFALGLNIGSWASRLADLKIAMSITDMELGFSFSRQVLVRSPLFRSPSGYCAM